MSNYFKIGDRVRIKKTICSDEEYFNDDIDEDYDPEYISDYSWIYTSLDIEDYWSLGVGKINHIIDGFEGHYEILFKKDNCVISVPRDIIEKAYKMRKIK